VDPARDGGGTAEGDVSYGATVDGMGWGIEGVEGGQL